LPAAYSKIGSLSCCHDLIFFDINIKI